MNDLLCESDQQTVKLSATPLLPCGPELLGSTLHAPCRPSTMPNAKLELDEAAIIPVIAELRDDANSTDYLILGEY
jgi:hypothetical protein